MYELMKLTDQTYYINCPAKIGIYVPDGKNAYLIDSGNDKDAGKKALRILTQNGWELKGILNTHSHADHIGGNRYLQNQTGCKVFCGGIEGSFTKNPVMEPTFLYGGFPGKDLRHKFLMAQDSEVSGLDDPDFPKEVKVIPLPGHSFDMVGYGMPDGTVFLADCISSPATLEKYAVSFLYDVEAYLATLDKVEKMEAPMFVPSHTDAASDISETIRINREKVYEIADVIVNICNEPKSFEQILQKVFQHYGLKMTFEQHALVGSTVRSYLSWLKEKGKMEISFEEEMLLWRAVGPIEKN